MVRLIGFRDNKPEDQISRDTGNTAGQRGDEKGEVLIAGSVRKDKLIIDADGDDTNIDQAVIDQLRDYSIIPEFVTDVSELDNQP